MTRSQSYTTLDLARAAGCSRKAVRLYQAKGLIPAPPKHRPARYDATTVVRLRLILSLRQLRMSIPDIAALFLVRDETGGGPAAARSLAVEIGESVRTLSTRIETLTRLRQELVEARETLFMCARCENPATTCPACAVSGKLDPVARALLIAPASPG